jgi:DNA-binding NtrC family response regulator
MDLNHMASAASMSALPPAPSAELLNLLIVDDERAVREGCQEAAESLGFQCFTAENTDSTYKILDSRGIDVVLLDVHLPNSGGVELLREIKRRRPQAAIIVTTGSATVHSAVRAMQHGAYDSSPSPLTSMK